MGMRIAVALAAAALVVLLLGSLARSAARRWGWRWPRRSGGVLIVAALPVAFVAASSVTTRALVIALAALLVAGFGLLRDAVDLPRWCTPIVVAGAAVAVALNGLRFAVGGVAGVDVGWTVLFLVAVTMAVSGLGSADGLVASVSAAAVAGVVGVAAFAEQGVAAAVPAALLGALCGFLAYNVRPASLHLGDSGSLFTGFLLGVCALWARPSIERPGALLVTLLLVAVPLTDGLVVVIGRLRRGHPLTVRIRDHLAHRLVGAGLSPARAIGFLVVVQLALCILAIFLARGVVPPAIAAAVGVVVLAVVVISAMRATIRGERTPGGARRIGFLVFVLFAFAVIASIPTALSAYASRDDIVAGRKAAAAALRAARAGETEQAAQLFAAAEQEFESASDRLDSPITTPSLVVPVVGANLHAARSLARIGAELSRAGRRLAENVDPDSLRVVDGRVPLESVDAVVPDLDAASRVLQGTKDDLAGIDTSFLVNEIDTAVNRLDSSLSKAARDAAHGMEAARIAHLVLGKDRPRRYLLVVQNPAELRGTGGLVGNWGILSASNGSVHLESLERVASLNFAGDPSTRVLNAPQDYVDRYERFDPAHTWQSVNISPDFPTVAGVMADLYDQSFTEPVDGVLAVDPLGLAALLELTGPVTVADWSTPITAQNVVGVTLHDAYQVFAQTPERADFLGDVARATIDRATQGVLGSPSLLGRVLGKAAHEGHISLWLVNPDEQRVAQVLGISGGVPISSKDSLIVSNTNSGGNKLDYYLHRDIDYSVTVLPSNDLTQAFTQGTIRVTLENSVPESGVAQIAAGPYEGATDRFVYGQNHSFLSVYTPLVFTAARSGSAPVDLEPGQELGRNVYSRFVDVFAQGSTDLSIDVAGYVALAPGGWYELTLMHQPILSDDQVTVRVAAPKGFEVVDAKGLKVTDGVAEGTIALERTKTVRIKLAHSGDRNLWERLRDGS